MDGVSIVICTYNRAALLAECLQSLLCKPAFPLIQELLVIDNASTDHTKAVVAHFATTLPQLRYCYESTIGLSEARNRGIDEARYNWVCYVDDDGESAPKLRGAFFLCKGAFRV